MALFVPLLLLFGFLTSLVRRGEDFPMLLSLMLVIMCLPTFVAALQAKRPKLVPLTALAVFGFSGWAVIGHAGVRFHAGPVMLGGSLVLALVWLTLIVGAISIAVGLADRYQRGYLFVIAAITICTLLAGLVVSPVFFALGITSYAGTGIFYGVPLVQHMLWLASGLVAGAVGAGQYLEDAGALPTSTLVGGMYLLAFCVGVATGEQLWLPALLGMLLLQYSFHLRNSL